MKKTDLIIFHYHLLPGGVTDVIRLSLHAFAGDRSVRSIKIVCGRPENSSVLRDHLEDLQKQYGASCPDLSLEVFRPVDYLDYLKGEPADPARLAEQLKEKYGGREKVWLIHNYHLGKNWVFTAALLRLASQKDQRMIFQIHDFPECTRYANLALLNAHIPGTLYPEDSTIRYCVINKRDFNLMTRAGIPGDRLFLLENPVLDGQSPVDTETDPADLKKKLAAFAPTDGIFHSDAPLWLYPVRSIRRKNILEGGFLVRLMDRPVNLAVTLPGISPQEKPYSDLVEKAFSEGLIPGFWGTGNLPEESGISYRDMICGSDLILSSSIQEGFGYMYLNAILWKKPLLARFLDIMGGFMPLFDTYPSHFYRTILIPESKKQKARLKSAYLSRFGKMQNELPGNVRDRVMSSLDELLDREGIDFSYLSPTDQYNALHSLSVDKDYMKESRRLNRVLLSAAAGLEPPAGASHTKELYDNYGLSAYRKAFGKILSSFDEPSDEMCRGKGTLPPDENLLNGFARLEYMRLIYS